MSLLHESLAAVDLADLIAAAQGDGCDDSPAMNEIIRRFDRKARQIAAAVALRIADRDDVVNAARLALVRAVRRHRGDYGRFPAYAAIFMTGAARRESKRSADLPETCLAGPDIVRVADGVSVARSPRADDLADVNGWGTGRVAQIISALPQRQQALLAERYIFDLDLGRIARLHGTSVSAVSQRLRTAHRQVLAVLRPPMSPALAT